MSLSRNRRIPDPFVEIGVILRPWGVRGFTLVAPSTEKGADRFKRVTSCTLIQHGAVVKTVEIEVVRKHRENILVKLKDVDTPEDAAVFRGASICIPEADVERDDEWTFFHYELVGLNVRTMDGRSVGVLKGVLETGANDVYVVETPEGEEVLLPAIRDVIRIVDIETGEMIIDPLEGMLPE